MLLAFSMSDIINVPFGYLMDILYQLTANYGVALILFAILVKLILLPVTAKSKKSTMKMARLTPRLKVIQKKYEHDPQKQAQMVQAFYKEEGVSMSGGCLWSFVPLLIMIPLYQVVRQPIVYMLHETAETAAEIVKIVADELPEVLTKKNEYYHQMIASSYIAKYADAIKEALPQVSDKVLAGLNFSFLGLDLSLIPSIFSINLTWQSIGGILIPVLSAGSQVLHTLITQKMNNSLVTDEKGVYDAQTWHVLMRSSPVARWSYGDSFWDSADLNTPDTPDVTDTPDLMPPLAIAAAATPGVTRITGAARLRLKESDRLSAMAQVIRALGGNAEEREDGLIIRGSRLKGLAGMEAENGGIVRPLLVVTRKEDAKRSCSA